MNMYFFLQIDSSTEKSKLRDKFLRNQFVFHKVGLWCQKKKIYIYIEKLPLCIQRLWPNFWAPCHISSHSIRWVSAPWAFLWLGLLRDLNLSISWQTSSMMSSLNIKARLLQAEDEDSENKAFSLHFIIFLHLGLLASDSPPTLCTIR